MRPPSSLARRFRSDAGDSGASAVEYALIVAAITAVVIAVVVGLGLVLNHSINNSCTHIKQTLNSNQTDTCVSSQP
jgi:Flp pilus assembly pilin Flp